MLPLQFRIEEEVMEFYDPRDGWKPIAQKTEVRYCPLTGRTSRLVPTAGFRIQPPDYRPAAEQTKALGCPFCPENIGHVTPKFPGAVHPEGRMRLGQAVLFPNLFPYGKHTGVVALTERHFVPLAEFTHEMLRDGFQLAVQYLNILRQNDPASTYMSINWNYMPVAGASMIHPHLQALATPNPSNYQRETLDAAQAFIKEHGISYYAWLMQEERRLAQRWIAENDAIAWVHAFAPQGQMDFLGILKDVSDLSHMSTSQLDQLSRDLLVIFAYLHEQGFAGFNLALFLPLGSPPGMQAHVHIVPRTNFGLIGTSEYNYVNVLHQEPVCLKKPEETAREIKKWFETAGS